jgi:predicted O-linked N-acetylglucosamine transferase (SPINDLY family)
MVQPMLKVERNSLCPCGSGKKYKHCCLQLDNTSPRQVKQTVQDAVSLVQVGRLAEAMELCQQLLVANPNHAETLHVTGLIAYQQGKTTGAIQLVEKAIAANPAEPLFYGNLAFLLRQLGRFEDALMCYERELKLKPGWPETLGNIGGILRALGRDHEAAIMYQRAIQIHPECAEWHSNLGNAYMSQGLYAEAIACYDRALEVNPNLIEAYINKGKVLLDLNLLDEATNNFQKALKIDPESQPANSNIGKAYLLQGYLAQARKAYQNCERNNTNSSILVKYAFHLPAIMGDASTLIRSRRWFEMALDNIFENETIVDPLKEGCSTNFYLAFHGLNDRELQIKIAQFYEKASPSLLYTAQHITRPQKTGRTQKRVGFFSKFIYSHSVSIAFGKIIEALSCRNDLDVVLISSQDHHDPLVASRYSAFKGQHLYLTGALAEARESVAALELDTLVYLDIGMEPLGYFMAFARLAPVQCVLTGHPVTTGIKNIDYFISGESVEPPDADDHYSERLIKLPQGAFYFQRPHLPVACMTREQIGLPGSGALYVCMPHDITEIAPGF